MAEWADAPDLCDLARRVIARREDVSHVDPNEVLFLWEIETTPKALARCYSLANHPIGLYTYHRFAIVFYEQMMGWMSQHQRAALMWHELKHIPERGDKLVQHDRQDFAAVLREYGVDWAANEHSTDGDTDEGPSDTAEEVEIDGGT